MCSIIRSNAFVSFVNFVIGKKKELQKKSLMIEEAVEEILDLVQKASHSLKSSLNILPNVNSEGMHINIYI